MKVRMLTSMGGQGFSYAPKDIVLINDEASAKRLIANHAAEQVDEKAEHQFEFDPKPGKAARGKKPAVETADDGADEDASATPVAKSAKA